LINRDRGLKLLGDLKEWDVEGLVDKNILGNYKNEKSELKIEILCND
jgi:uncharacterized lipoprotein YddW (UPF0748 family)